MTTCDEVKPLLFAYELGAAEAPERDACDAHLAGCPACLAGFFKLKRMREDAAAFDERPSTAERDRLRGRVSQRGRLRRPVLWAVAAAALVVAALALRFFTQPGTPPRAPVLVDSAPLTEDVL